MKRVTIGPMALELHEHVVTGRIFTAEVSVGETTVRLGIADLRVLGAAANAMADEYARDVARD